MNCLRRRTPPCLAAGLAVILAACAGGPQVAPVDIRDSSASVVSVRADWLFRTQATGTLGEVSDGVEVQYLRMKGGDDQTVPAGQAIVIGGQAIPGPREVAHSAEITYGHVAYSGTARWPGRPLDLDVFLGAGRTGLRLRTSATTSASRVLETEETDYGLSLGGGIRWWFIENSAVEGRFIIMTQNPLIFLGGGFGDGGQTDLFAGELALVFRPVRHVALRGGYGMMSLTPERSSDSPIDVVLKGPFIGLGISF